MRYRVVVKGDIYEVQKKRFFILWCPIPEHTMLEHAKMAIFNDKERVRTEGKIVYEE